jgi:hypothetical protein
MSTTPRTAAPTPAAAPQVEIWIRTAGSRRQAFCRPSQPAGQRTRCWHAMSVASADKALRTGTLSTGPFTGAAAINQQIDTMFSGARAAA